MFKNCVQCGDSTTSVVDGVCRACDMDWEWFMDLKVVDLEREETSGYWLDVLVVVGVLTALAVAADTPSRGLPSGHLYSVLMRVTDLGHYQAILATLKSAGFVEERGHYLTATAKGVELGRELVAELKARDPNCASCGASMVLEHDCPKGRS